MTRLKMGHGAVKYKIFNRETTTSDNIQRASNAKPQLGQYGDNDDEGEITDANTKRLYPYLNLS